MSSIEAVSRASSVLSSVSSWLSPKAVAAVLRGCFSSWELATARRRPSLVEAAQHAFGLGDMLLLAGEIARGLSQTRLELRLAGLGARFLAFERVALDTQPMQYRGARRLLVAQRLKLLGGLGLLAQRLALGLGLLRHCRKRLLEVGLLLLDQRASRDPMKMMLQRLDLAHLGRDSRGNAAPAAPGA